MPGMHARYAGWLTGLKRSLLLGDDGDTLSAMMVGRRYSFLIFNNCFQRSEGKSGKLPGRQQKALYVHTQLCPMLYSWACFLFLRSVWSLLIPNIVSYEFVWAFHRFESSRIRWIQTLFKPLSSYYWKVTKSSGTTSDLVRNVRV